MTPFQEYTIEEILQTGIALVIIFSGVLAILYSIWGGFLLITSGGNEEKIKPAVNHIRHAFIGLLVLVLILFIAPKILELFSLPYADTIKPRQIFSRIQELSSTLFSQVPGRSIEIDSTSDSSLPTDFSDL